MQVSSTIDVINQSSSAKTGTTTSGGPAGFQSSDFMALLMAQLTHQNPLEPMNDAEMMNQFVQLNSLQQLQEIKTSMQQVMVGSQTSYAASLMGKTVVISKPDGTSEEGKVAGFSLENNKVLVQVGEKSYPLDQVVKVLEEPIDG